MAPVSYMTPALRRTISVVMALAIGMILMALVWAGVHFKGEAEVAKARSAAAAVDREKLRAELAAATDATNALLQLVDQSQATSGQRLQDAVDKLVAAQTASIRAEFEKDRVRTQAEFARLRAELKAAQDELARRISAIVQGPAGPPGAPGAPGPKGNCQLVCL